MVLGLTGGIATGKSTVSSILIGKGYKIVDADKIAKEIAENIVVLEEIEKEFGKEFVSNNKLNRKLLREVVFKDKKKVEKLNGIMHPPIIEEIKRQLIKYKNEEIIIADIPLIFESKLEYLTDKILLIACEKEIQIKRVMKRDNVTEENAKNIIDKQLSLDVKREKSDYIIENNLDIGSLGVEVEKVIEEIKTYFNTRKEWKI